MAGEVNKIISDLLLHQRGVFLPSVGSLVVEFVSATMPSVKEITPPYGEILFSSQRRGIALPEEIMRTAGCTATEAEDIYERWLSKTFHDGELIIEGVGKLKFKNFTVEAAFDAVLNPAGHTPRKLKPAHRFWRTAGWILVVLAVAICGVAWWFYIDIRNTTPEAAGDNMSVIAVSVAAETIPVPVIDTLPFDATVEEQPAVEKDATIVLPYEVQQPEKGKTYVIFGLFSSEENAHRAIEEAKEIHGQTTFIVYTAYGDKYLVSVFENNDRKQCSDFIRNNSGRLGDLWPYTQK